MLEWIKRRSWEYADSDNGRYIVYEGKRGWSAVHVKPGSWFSLGLPNLQKAKAACERHAKSKEVADA